MHPSELVVVICIPAGSLWGLCIKKRIGIQGHLVDPWIFRQPLDSVTTKYSTDGCDGLPVRSSMFPCLLRHVRVMDATDRSHLAHRPIMKIRRVIL
jgi:hypothetical protein